MIFGTSSGAGKSLMSAAICRVLLRRGEKPFPFKGQNMSNNAWVDKSGGEMAFSQAMQAWAAGLTPECRMNPILLKPKGDSTSEVVHMGKTVGIARAEKYYEDWFDSGWESINRALNEFKDSNKGSRLVIEGAGSPVEVNLQDRDLTNLRIANLVQARCLLVADIERGGVFAQLIGTLTLLKPDERKLIKGIIINRFRGRRELFEEGKNWIEKETGIPVLGIMPWLNNIFPPEDTLDLLEYRKPKSGAQIEIGVVRLPSISNFSDFDPLQSEPTVQLKWIELGQKFNDLDALIIPGSKQTLNDLEKVIELGLADQIKNYIEKGGNLFGICGGMQMLGSTLEDPFGLEHNLNQSNKGIVNGLDILPIRTRFMKEKKLIQRELKINWPESLQINGFELHRGETKLIERNIQIHPLSEYDTSIGWVLKNKGKPNHIVGTYLHGIFDNGRFRRLWLNDLRRQKGLDEISVDEVHYSSKINSILDLLADQFEKYIDISPLISSC